MKLLKSLGLLAAGGALMVAAPSSQATVTFKSSVTVKLTATVQDSTDVSTSDGSVDTALKLSIVNKDILAAFEDWWDTTLPSGADLALDQSYNIVIVDKDGDILFDSGDLDGFLDLVYGSSITSDGRTKEKDNGDYTDKYTQTYFISVVLLGDNEERNAEINSGTDLADLIGLDVYSYSDSYDASKNDYKFSSTDKATVQGTGVIEDSDAAITGQIKTKYTYKDDDYE